MKSARRAACGWCTAIRKFRRRKAPLKSPARSTTRPDGSPEHYDWSTQGAKKASAAISFSADVATAELHMEGARAYTQQFTFNSPNVVILDDNMYHQYQILAGLYDMDKKGSQTFAVLVPQELTPGTVTVETMGKQDVDGKKMEALRVRTDDNEIDLYLDGPKLMRLVAPAPTQK